jgi:hypothetical protein
MTTRSTSLWNPNGAQVTRIFGWAELLEDWTNNINSSPYIDIVRNNLRFATEFPNSYAFPLTHFTNYLNQEQEGIKWLIYEICAVRWMFGRICVNYLRELVDMVDSLDSGFPAFLGSPGESTTVREFLEGQLTEEELEFVGMMPRLVNTPVPPPVYQNESQEQVWYDSWSPPSPPRVARSWTIPNTPVRPPRPASAAAAVPAAAPSKRTPILFRFIRRMKDEASNDDVIRIVPSSNPNATDLYTVVFTDGEADTKTRSHNFTQDDVVHYLSNTLRLVELDEGPYDSVQVILPNMPMVLISPGNLTSQTRDLIYDSVETTMRHWPKRV